MSYGGFGVSSWVKFQMIAIQGLRPGVHIANATLTRIGNKIPVQIII